MTDCKNTFGRIVKRYSNTAGVQPTIPASSDHKDGTWLSTDIYEGEEFVNTADGRAYIRANNTIKEYFLGSLYGGCKTYCTSGTITSGQVSTLFSSPITVITAPGAGKIIKLESVICKLNFSTAAWTSVNIRIGCSTATKPQFTDSNSYQLLRSTVSRMFAIPPEISGVDAGWSTSDTLLIENDSVTIKTNADPTGGYGSIDYYLWYRIINL